MPIYLPPITDNIKIGIKTIPFGKRSTFNSGLFSTTILWSWVMYSLHRIVRRFSGICLQVTELYKGLANNKCSINVRKYCIQFCQTFSNEHITLILRKGATNIIVKNEANQWPYVSLQKLFQKKRKKKQSHLCLDAVSRLGLLTTGGYGSPEGNQLCANPLT